MGRPDYNEEGATSSSNAIVSKQDKTLTAPSIRGSQIKQDVDLKDIDLTLGGNLLDD